MTKIFEIDKYELRQIVLFVVLFTIGVSLLDNCIQVKKEYKISYVEMNNAPKDKILLKAKDVKEKIKNDLNGYSTLRYNNTEYFTLNQINEVLTDMSAGKFDFSYANEDGKILLQQKGVNSLFVVIFIAYIIGTVILLKKIFY